MDEGVLVLAATVLVTRATWPEIAAWFERR